MGFTYHFDRDITVNGRDYNIRGVAIIGEEERRLPVHSLALEPVYEYTPVLEEVRIEKAIDLDTEEEVTDDSILEDIAEAVDLDFLSDDWDDPRYL